MTKALKSLLLLLALAVPAQAAELPTDPDTQSAIAVVEALDAGLQAAMNGEVSATYADRAALLTPLMTQAFDYPFMAQVAAGKYWKGFSAAEQASYAKLFEEVSVAAAASRFKAKAGSTFAVTGAREAPDGRRYVETTLSVPGRDPLKIAYLVQKGADGTWKAVDLFYNGTVSELATKRSEYGSILKSEGLAGLEAKLRAKAAQYAAD